VKNSVTRLLGIMSAVCLPGVTGFSALTDGPDGFEVTRIDHEVNCDWIQPAENSCGNLCRQARVVIGALNKPPSTGENRASRLSLFVGKSAI
jgi:hypothetical protein